MSRRIVFAGGSQIRALARAYRSEVASETDEDILFVGAEAVGRDAARRAIDAADLLVSEALETGTILTEEMARPGVEMVRVPHVIGDFLWPNAGRPHPLNRGEFVIPGGPYPADFGDSFLDSMMEEGVPEDQAVERYLAMDLAADGRLDGMRDARRAIQEKLDEASGFAFGEFIDGHFRGQPLFLSRERPGLPLVRRIAAAVFRRLGADPAKAGNIRQSPFQGGSLPLHPSVVRHFGLSYVPADRRSAMNDEGRFTFEEYCRRYYRFEWNEPLHLAMARAADDPVGAIPELERALLRSPGSRRGQRVLERAQRAAANRAAYAPLTGEPEDEAPEPQVPALIPPSTPALVPAEPMRRPARPVESKLDLIPFPTLLGSGQTAPAPPPPAPEPVVEAAAFTEFEPQAYVELPRFGEPDPVPPPAVPPRDPRLPLPPSTELIQVLPRLLPKPHGLVGVTDRPFHAMPETMPPPPLRPVLPPELPPELPRPGFLSRLFRRGDE